MRVKGDANVEIHIFTVMVGSDNTRSPFDCHGQLPEYSLRAALECETKQTWHSQHFVNPLLFYVTTQNVVLSLLIPGLAEVCEAIMRAATMGRRAEITDADGEEAREGLFSMESPMGSLIYDWLIQGFGGVLTGIFLVEFLNIYLKDVHFWTCRLLWGLAIFGFTIVTEIVCTFLETRYHILAVVLVALTNIIGFVLIRLLYESNVRFTCCCFRNLARYRKRKTTETEHDEDDICDSMTPASGKPREWTTFSKAPAVQLGTYAIVVYLVLLAGASTRKVDAYKYLFAAEIFIVVVLVILLFACPRADQWEQFMRRNGCMREARYASTR